MTTEYQYLNLIGQIRQSDAIRMDRTGTGTQSVFGRQIRFDLSKGFPLLTTKKVALRLVIEELVWMLAGDTNAHTLRDKNVNIWNEWALEDGSLGPVYGGQWRHWKTYATESQTRSRTLSEALVDAIRTGDSALAADMFGLATIYRDRPELSLVGVAQEYPTMKLLSRFKEHGIEPTVTEDKLVEGEIDQIAVLMDGLKNKPFSRRHIVSAWNVAELANEKMKPWDNVKAGLMALSPCHALFQFYVEYRPMPDVRAEAGDALVAECAEFIKTLGGVDGGKDWKAAIALNDQIYQFYEERGIKTKRLSCQLYQRSADTMLGVPFNIASYALLTMMIAQCAGMVAGDFIHTFGDLHIYTNHFEGAVEQLQREPKGWPKLWINPEVKDIFGFKVEDFKLEGYEPHPTINFDISV